MARRKGRRGLRFKGAQTTVLRDYIRRRRDWRYLRRGGRPRSSAWWRAWIARLLGTEELAPPAPVAPLPLSSNLDHPSDTLTITFDAPLDLDSTVLASQFRYGDGVEMYTASGIVQISGVTVTVTVVTPPQLPFGSGAWLFAGAGELRGENGAAVQPFGPV